MPSTPASQERVDLQFGLLLDPARHPGLTSRQITDRVMAAIGKEFGDVGITGVRTVPRSAAFGEPTAGPVGPITTDWQVTLGKAGSAETVSSNPMTMTSGATGTVNGTADQRLLDAIALAHHYSKLGALDDDKGKAASRHARHQQAAIKAVGGARQLLGSAVAEPLSEHVRALVADVEKASSVAAGYASLVKSLLAELGATRRQAAELRRDRDTAAAAIRNTLPAEWLVNNDPMPTMVHAACAAYSQAKHTLGKLEPTVFYLLQRPHNYQLSAAQTRIRHLEARIEGAMAAGKIPTSTGRSWLRSAANAEDGYCEQYRTTGYWAKFEEGLEMASGTSLLPRVAYAHQYATDMGVSAPSSNA